MPMLPELVYRFNVIPIKTLKHFHRNRKSNNIKWIWNYTKDPKYSIIFDEENANGIILPDFKIHYKDIVNKLYSAGLDRHIDQWNRIKIQEIPHINGQLIFNKGMENMQCRKDSLFNKGC